MIKVPSSFKKEQLMFENWRQFLESDQVEPTAWLQMVRENYEAILAEDPLNEDLIEEGVWSKIKYYMGKMGSLEKGGKILGRGKRTAAALDKLEAAIEAAAKKGFGDFRKKLEADYPEFPNMEKKEDFVNALMDIGAVYDSIDAAVAKYDDQGAQVKGGLDPDSANAMVSALREYVTFLLDYKLADSYKHFTEDKDRIDEAPPPVGGVAQVGGGEKRTPATSSIAGGGGAPEDPDAPKGKYTKRGADGDTVDSETIKGLESNVLPILLALTGLAGVLIGLLLKTPWALEMLKSIRGLKESGSVTETVKDTVKVFTKIKKVLAPQAGEGFTQMFGRIAAGDPAAFGPQTTPGELFGVMQKMGVDPENPTQLFELGVDPQAYAEAIQGNAGTLGEMFPASNQSLWLDKGTEAIAEAQKETTETITKSVTKTVGGGGAAVAAGQLAAASTLATTLGIGLIASGAAVKLLRMKGLKSSRAQMFQDLSKELQPFQGGKIEPVPPPPPPECPEGTVPDPETGKCVPEPDPVPPPVAIKKPGIAVLDDDTVSIFRIRWRKQDKVDAQRDIYQAAQDAAIIGRGTNPTSDQVADPSNEYRPFKADKKTFAQIKKKAAGKSGEEPLFAIDGSIIGDLGNKSGKSKGAGLRRAGIGKERAKKIVRFLFKDMLRRERKPSDKMVNYAMRRLKIDDPAQQDLVRAQLAAYGLAQPVKPQKKPVKESLSRGWKLLSDGTIRRVSNEKK